MKTNNTYDIFISYSSKNKNNAKKLASYLDDNGIKVWFDYWELSFEEDIIKVIGRAIEKSKIIFTLIDSNYLNSQWMKKEFEASLEKNKKNILFIGSDVDTFNLSNSLSSYQYIKIDYNNLDSLLEKLQDIDDLFKEKYLSINAKKLYEESSYLSSLEEYNRLLKILNNSSDNNKMTISITYNNMASIYQVMGDYSKSLKLYLKSLKISQKLNLESNIAVLYNNIASIYQTRGDYDKALKYYEKALEVNKKIDNLNAIAIGYNNIASLFQFRGDIEKALEYAHVSLHKFKKLFGENDISLANNYNTLAVLYKSIKASDIALKFMNKSLKIQLEFLGENHPNIGKAYNNLALFLYEKEEYNKAYEYMEQSIKILDNFLDKNNKYLENSKKILSKIKLRKNSRYSVVHVNPRTRKVILSKIVEEKKVFDDFKNSNLIKNNAGMIFGINGEVAFKESIEIRGVMQDIYTLESNGKHIGSMTINKKIDTGNISSKARLSIKNNKKV